MNKVLLVCVAGLLVFSAPGFAEKGKTAPRQPAQDQIVVPATKDWHSDNPIDRAFSAAFEKAQATPEINFVNEAYLDAWKAEMTHVAGLVKKSLTHKEDLARVDEYLAAYETLGKKAFDLEMLNWTSDPDAAPADRSFGSGGPGAAMLAQGRLYKQATLNLITHFQADPDKAYVFAFAGKGPDLDALRKQQDSSQE